MRILILDDDRLRHEAFAKHFASHEVVHVYFYTAFVAAIVNDDVYDLVHLDHDLEDYVDYEPGFPSQGQVEMTGTDAAVFIARRLPQGKQPLRIVIHSWNSAGAQRMRNILQQETTIPTVYEPFQP